MIDPLYITTPLLFQWTVFFCREQSCFTVVALLMSIASVLEFSLIPRQELLSLWSRADLHVVGGRYIFFSANVSHFFSSLQKGAMRQPVGNICCQTARDNSSRKEE